MTHEFICSQCKQHKVHESDFSTGYARDKDDNKICFDCCGLNDGKELRELPIGGKTWFYLSNGVITNWPGTLKIENVSITKGRHNMAGVRYDAWFKYSGNSYHGVQYGDNTQVCHIKRIKA